MNLFPFRRAPRLRDLARAADAERDAGHWAQAALAYRAVLERYPDRTDIWIQYGHALKESGHIVDAELAYRQAALRCDTDADICIQLGHALKLQHKQGEALEAYQQALRLNPDSEAARNELAALGFDFSGF